MNLCLASAQKCPQKVYLKKHSYISESRVANVITFRSRFQADIGGKVAHKDLVPPNTLWNRDQAVGNGRWHRYEVFWQECKACIRDQAVGNGRWHQGYST